jgi:carbamoyl-phosphate synthase large subunit
MKNINLMLLSPGRRVYTVERFRDTLHLARGKLFTLDITNYAPALYSSDKHFIIEKDFLNIDSYVDKVLDICIENEINSVLTLIDPELVLLAKNQKRFINADIVPIISDYSAIVNSFDKYRFYNAYKDILKVIPTYNSYDEVVRAINDGSLNFPVFAKMRNGSGSFGICKLDTAEWLELYRDKSEYIFQPFIQGKEYGVDIYFDIISGKITSLFIKHSMSMRAGETDKAVSVYRQDIVDEIMKIQGFGFRGPINVDVFIDDNEQIYINEINPRFGGGYPHAHHAGVNHIENIINNLNGIENKINIGNYQTDLVMMKYSCKLFCKLEDMK